MPKLIKLNEENVEIVADPWVLIAKGATLEETLNNSSSTLLVPLQLWLDNKEALVNADKQIAVWLNSDETAEILADDCASFELIALNFPTFTDGRSYSTAGKLRQHYRYTGELRAIGDVLRDQLTFLKRCGFDSFNVADDVKEKDVLSAFDDFKDHYQSTVERSKPLYQRR